MALLEKGNELPENDVLYNDDDDIADIFNFYFNRITEHLDIPVWESLTLTLYLENHPSIRVIREHRSNRKIF